MKNKITAIIVIVIICATIGLGIYWSHYIVESSYNEVIALTQDNKYAEAISKLKTANSNKNFENDLKRYITYEIKPEDKYYRDSWTIYPFILAMQEYTTDKDIGEVKRYLDLIPESYLGDLSKEISDFRGAIAPEVAEYDAEQARKAEEARIAMEKAHQEFMAELRTKLPYEGMSEDYIDSTMMGKHDKFIPDDDNDDFVYNLYYWDTNSGDTLLAVTCINGKVDHVSKYGIGYFWTSDGKPNYNGKNPYTSSSYKSKKKTYDDPYDVNEYSDPEDFYYDNYDDFWDYEEAEDYYNSYHEDP
jgi:hypothetical protein